MNLGHHIASNTFINSFYFYKTQIFFKTNPGYRHYLFLILFFHFFRTSSSSDSSLSEEEIDIGRAMLLTKMKQQLYGSQKIYS